MWSSFQTCLDLLRTWQLQQMLTKCSAWWSLENGNLKQWDTIPPLIAAPSGLKLLATQSHQWPPLEISLWLVALPKLLRHQTRY